jgi:ABC-type sugar transport system ATPase subunit
VALARAIVREPAAFLFDEPLSNLDARLRVSTRSEIKDLQRRLGTTALYVTHDQEEALSLGDRIAVICRGRLQQVGTPLEVYGNPANRFVASFIGSPPMNLLEGRLEAAAGGLVFVEEAPAQEGVELPLPDRWQARLEAMAGRPMVLGVRPQALHAPGLDDTTLQVEIEHVEVLGEMIDLVGVTAGRQRFVARLPIGDDTSATGPRRLGVDMTRALAFEPGPFGRNLLLPCQDEPAAG